MENETKLYFFAINTEHGISIMAESDKTLNGFLADSFKSYGFDTPEEAVDHLMAEMLMKASKLRLEAEQILERLVDFQELERTQLENIYETDDIFEAVYELLPCNICPINPGNGKCNCLESMDGAYK